MTRTLISNREAEAALEKALREGWITPEQAAEMRRRQGEREESGGGPPSRKATRLLRRWIGLDGRINW